MREDYVEPVNTAFHINAHESTHQLTAQQRLVHFVTLNIQHVLRENSQALHGRLHVNVNAVAAFYTLLGRLAITAVGPHGNIVHINTVQLGVSSSRIPENMTAGVIEGDERTGTLFITSHTQSHIVSSDGVHNCINIANVS